MGLTGNQISSVAFGGAGAVKSSSGQNSVPSTNVGTLTPQTNNRYDAVVRPSISPALVTNGGGSKLNYDVVMSAKPASSSTRYTGGTGSGNRQSGGYQQDDFSGTGTGRHSHNEVYNPITGDTTVSHIVSTGETKLQQLLNAVKKDMDANAPGTFEALESDIQEVVRNNPNATVDKIIRDVLNNPITNSIPFIPKSDAETIKTEIKPVQDESPSVLRPTYVNNSSRPSSTSKPSSNQNTSSKPSMSSSSSPKQQIIFGGGLRKKKKRRYPDGSYEEEF